MHQVIQTNVKYAALQYMPDKIQWKELAEWAIFVLLGKSTLNFCTSEDSYNNRECQAIVNRDSSSRQTILGGAR